ncbi:MAG TPA: hypothetical protein VJ650_02550 [Gemmatimonadaceae bacterium]|nr:hypothetical protein [Gemmatimonadaceae bacterium]
MRTVRWLATAIAFAALTPAVASAQEGRLFKDAWFWGAKAGVMSFSNGFDRHAAPLVGIEWLITRTKGGLYISGEQLWFDEQTALVDNNGNGFTVDMKNMKRVTVSALAFPVSYGTLRPYAGVGFAVNWISNAMVVEPFQDQTQQHDIWGQIDDRRDQATFLLMGGVQAQYRRFSVFGQAVLQPRSSGFLLGGKAAYVLEGGIRLNLGSSRDNGL